MESDLPPRGNLGKIKARCAERRLYSWGLAQIACQCGVTHLGNAGFETVCRILAAGLLIRKILVNPTGALVLFKGGEQFYAPGLRIGIEGAATAALARVAEKAGFGEREELFHFYRDLPADWNEDLPDLNMRTLPRSIRASIRAAQCV